MLILTTFSNHFQLENVFGNISYFINFNVLHLTSKADPSGPIKKNPKNKYFISKVQTIDTLSDQI